MAFNDRDLSNSLGNFDSFALSSCRLTSDRSAKALNGFMKCASAPAAFVKVLSTSRPRTVAITTGMCFVSDCDFRILQTSSPLFPGIIKSNMIKSGSSLSAFASASSPSDAVITLYPSSSRIVRIKSRRMNSSSTIKTLSNPLSHSFRSVLTTGHGDPCNSIH